MIDWLATLVAPLNHILFQLGGDRVSWAELLGFITGGLCVWLTVRAHLANFAVGIANSAFFLVLFLSARLWADGCLQILYILLGFLGWWQWMHPGRVRQQRTTVRASQRELVCCLGFVLVATAALYPILRQSDDIAPFWDALTTALSLAAQWLLNTKKLQTWWFWIAADCVYVPLYLVKQLDLTAVVYVLFLILCVVGLRAWRTEFARRRSADLVSVSA